MTSPIVGLCISGIFHLYFAGILLIAAQGTELSNNVFIILTDLVVANKPLKMEKAPGYAQFNGR